MRCIWSIAIILCGFTALGANYSLPSHRSYDWSENTGVVGGIPAVTSLHSNVVLVGADNTGSLNAAGVIQAALNNCPSNSYVYLPAGRYLLNSTLSLPSGTVIRGDGFNTVLLANHSGDAVDIQVDVTPTLRTNIAAHVEKGSTNLWISENHEDVSPGNVIAVTYYNNPQPLVWNPSGGTSATNTTQRMRFMVLGTNANQVHISPAAPLDCLTNNRVLLSSIGTRLNAVLPKRMCGVENLSITNHSGTMPSGVNIQDAYNCWVSGVQVRKPSATSGGIVVNNGVRITIKGCFINRRTDGDDVDGISIAGEGGLGSTCAASTGVLIENCATDGMWPGIQLGENGGCVGNAVLYCYIVNPYVSTASDWIASSIATHGGHSGMNLIEGNVCEGFVQLDAFHSSASHWTFYKNWFKGASGESGKVARRWTMDLCRYSYTNSVIRNVLGVTGYSWTLTTTNNGFAYDAFNLIYRMGYPNMGNQGYSAVRPPTTITNYDALDLNVTNSIILHGNYDYANAGFVYESGESTAFDDSLYYAEKPSYFGTLSWPRDGMEVTNRIPAMAFVDGDWSFTNAVASSTRGIPLRGIRLHP